MSTSNDILINVFATSARVADTAWCVWTAEIVSNNRGILRLIKLPRAPRSPSPPPPVQKKG